MERRTVKLDFSDSATFLREYRSNLSKGGLFVRADELFKLRELIDVEFVLAFCGESVVVSGEVVGIVSKALSASGEPGIAVQLHETSDELESRFQKYFPAPPEIVAKPETSKDAMANLSRVRTVPRADLPVEADQQRLHSSASLGKPIALKKVPRIVPRETLSSSAEAVAELRALAKNETGNSAASALHSREFASKDSFPIDEFSMDDLSSGDLSLDDLLPEVPPELPYAVHGAVLIEKTRVRPPVELPPVHEAASTPVASSAHETASTSNVETNPAKAVSAAADADADNDERRIAPRAPVHLAGQIESTSGAQTILSQNISHSGVLLAVDGKSIPVGEQVNLVLHHPVTGDELALSGSVARHQEKDGSVVALAIRFAIPEDQRKEVSVFIDDVKAAEHAQSLAGIHGLIAEMGAPKVLQMFAMTVSEGTLRFKRSDEEGTIVFRAGMLRYANAGAVSGCKALWRLMSWNSGQFEFRGQAVDTPETDEVPIMLHDAILQGVTQIADLKHLDLEQFPTAARLTLKKKFPKNLNEIESTIVDLVRSNFTVRRILDVIPDADLEIYRALLSLKERDVLHVVQTS